MASTAGRGKKKKKGKKEEKKVVIVNKNSIVKDILEILTKYLVIKSCHLDELT